MIVTEVLGSEYDLELANALLEVLRDMGADAGVKSWALGGSQEISTAHFSIQGTPLTVEAETYVGLSLTGDPLIVKVIVDRVLNRAGN